MKRPWRPAFAALSAALAACGGDDGATSQSTGSVGGDGSGESGATGNGATNGASSASGGAIVDFVVGGDRPVTVHVPPGLDASTKAPLLIMLHGYTLTGAFEESYLELGPVAAANGMLYAAPDGTVDTAGNTFWNATDACCNLYGSTVDDSAYLAGIVTEIETRANVDPKRIYFMGHSNGGFMSYRMACDHADLVAAFVSLAGATYATQSDCHPSEPVAMVEIHGDADEVIAYGGGSIGSHVFPSAQASAGTWASYDGCENVIDTQSPDLDLDGGLDGPSGPAESTVQIYATGCQASGHAELWTIVGGHHSPAVTPTFREAVIAFLLAHPKP